MLGYFLNHTKLKTYNMIKTADRYYVVADPDVTFPYGTKVEFQLDKDNPGFCACAIAIRLANSDMK